MLFLEINNLKQTCPRRGQSGPIKAESLLKKNISDKPIKQGELLTLTGTIFDLLKYYFYFLFCIIP